jgi:hypothetical protein
MYKFLCKNVEQHKKLICVYVLLFKLAKFIITIKNPKKNLKNTNKNIELTCKKLSRILFSKWYFITKQRTVLFYLVPFQALLQNVINI